MDVQTPPKEYFGHLTRQIEVLKKAQLRQGERPRDGPPRNALIQQFTMAAMMQKIQQTGQGHFMRANFIPPAYPPCISPLSHLEITFIKDLQLETHHRGKYLLLRAVTPPRRMTAIMAIMEDEKDDVSMLSLYHCEEEDERPAEDIVRPGTILLIKEPYFKVHGDGGYGLRVDHITDVLHIDEDDERVPSKWRQRPRQVHSSADTLRKEGNAAVGQKKYWEAIAKYSKALTLQAPKEELEIIKRNRSLAYLNTGHFDAALADTGFPDWQSVEFNEKAMFRAAEALYKLRRFRESSEVLESICSKYPGNQHAQTVLARARDRVREQETGEYDFKRLQREAKQLRPPQLDHATYIGPVEVRQTERKGRGLFTTQDVKAGDLLLCEKAFCHGFYDEDKSLTTLLMNIETKKGFMGSQADLLTNIIHKLHRNPSIADDYTSLFHGDYEAKAPAHLEGEVEVVDTFLVERIISHNVFGCPRSSYLDYIKVRSKSDGIERSHKSSGIWTMASYINHGCVSNVDRSFIGDMMIVRATRDISTGTELFFWYRPCDDDAKEVQDELRKAWGFTCDCPICTDQSQTAGSVLSERRKLFARAAKLFKEAKGIAHRLPVGKMSKLLSQLEHTYTRPANEVPRIRLGHQQFTLSEAYRELDRWQETLEWVQKGLTSLGFVLVDGQTTTEPFRIDQWGVVTERLITALLCAAEAFNMVGSKENSSRAAIYAKLAYEMTIGEDATFDELYG